MRNPVTALINKMRFNPVADDAVYLPKADVSDVSVDELVDDDTYFVEAIVDGYSLMLLDNASKAEATKLFAKLEEFRFATDRRVEYLGVVTSCGGEVVIVRESLGAFSYGKEHY